MSNVNDKCLRNLRCRRMLIMAGEDGDTNKVTSGEIAYQENKTIADDDYSPDVSEYIPSRSLSPDSSPIGKSRQKHKSKPKSQNIFSPCVSAISSLANTPKSRQKSDVNFVASPTVLYDVKNSELPEISNVDLFLKNLEQCHSMLDSGLVNMETGDDPQHTENISSGTKTSAPSTSGINNVCQFLQPRSFNSDSVDETRNNGIQIDEAIVAVVQKPRKRLRNTNEWIDIKNKRLKNSGQPYFSIRSKKTRGVRISGGTCACKRECSAKIGNDVREKIFKLYWGLGNHEKQWEFLLRYISTNNIKRMQLIRKNNRTQTITYKLPCNMDLTEDTIICKKMFLKTLGITEKVVYTAIEKRNTSMHDLRGTHLNRPKRMSDETKNSIINHIKEFPVVESHYIRKDSTRLYLNETLNISMMYRMYKEWFESNTQYKDIKMASKSQYEFIFNTNFNYSFFRPKKDLCDRCSIYHNADDERKNQLEEDQKKHIEEKDTVRRMKDLEKEELNKTTQTLASFDLEKVLYIPQSEVSSFYYKRKYPIYNFTIYNMLTKKGYCFLWHYQIAKRGANDIASCLYHYIKQESRDGKKLISFYSDSCTGQNRNRIVFAMYLYVNKQFSINITHRFFVKGHSQSEGDMMHSCIERSKKRHTIYTPDQMYCIINNAKVSKEKFSLKEMQQSDFYDFKRFVSDKSKNWFQDDNSEKIYWSKIREVKIDCATPDKLFFRYSLDSEYKCLSTNRLVSRRRKNIIPEDQTLQAAYTALLSIPRPLYNDLMSLCNSEAIPTQYQEFYRKLAPNNQSSTNEASELEDEEDEDVKE